MRLIAVVLTIPLAGLLLLLAVPELDVAWEHHQSHFWLVLLTAVLCVVLALATSEAASRRGDTRTFLISMALMASAGFLGLHALATPRVILEGPNAGFTIATPVGLLLASVLAAASVLHRFDAKPLGAAARRSIRGVLLVIIAGWAVASLAGAPLLDQELTTETPLALRVLAPAAIALYAWAALRYGAIYRQRRHPLPLTVAVALALLAEAMVAVVFSRTWHATWWEWHLLMLVAFAAIFVSARAEYRRAGSVAEAFSGLYQSSTLALVDRQTSDALSALAAALREGRPLDRVREELRGRGMTGERIAALERSAGELRRVDDLLRSYVGSELASHLTETPELADLGGRTIEATVLFADLVGFTSYSEARAPEAGMELLNTYWAAVVPSLVDDFGGLIERFAGDGILVVFNALGTQPDHAVQAVQAGLALQETIGQLAEGHPDWPRFRVGINTGPVVIGNVGAGQRQNFTVIGDTANTAARFEALARPGHVLMGRTTRDLVQDEVETISLGAIDLKGKALPQEVYEAVA